jgi:hypothetical protein
MTTARIVIPAQAGIQSWTVSRPPFILAQRPPVRPNPMFEFLIVLALASAALVWIYNRLVRDRNQVLAAWSDIDVQLVRRHSLVPQLVTTVKAYADY